MSTALRLFCRLFLIGALLGGQHAAIAHELWHAAQGDAGSLAPKQGEGEPQKKFCDLHDVLGSVLGAIQGAAATSLAACETLESPAAAWAAPCGVDAVHPSSRGPPALS